MDKNVKNKTFSQTSFALRISQDHFFCRSRNSFLITIHFYGKLKFNARVLSCLVMMGFDGFFAMLRWVARLATQSFDVIDLTSP